MPITHIKSSFESQKAMQCFFIGVALLFFVAAVCCQARRVHVALDWETGTVDSGLSEPLKPSFSINGDGYNPPKNPASDYCQPKPEDKEKCWPTSAGKSYVNGGKDIHSLSVLNVSWARKGDFVLKVYGDGRNYGSSGDYAFRSELSAVQDQYVFLPGDYQFYSMSFWLDHSWDQVSKYSGLLMQWKMSPGFPHGALRISNLGDYKLYFRGYHLWEDNGNGKFIGFAKPQAWNDVKFFYKKSMSKDGFVFVWLNGRLVFEHHGPTLLKSTQRGYTKFGQYTEIRDERVVYYDAVEFCHTDEKFQTCLDAMGYSSLGSWLRQGDNAPTVRIRQVNNQPVANTAFMPLGSNVTIVVYVEDLEGKKYKSPGGIQQVELLVENCSLGTVNVGGSTSRNVTFHTEALSRIDASYKIVAVVTDTDGNVVESTPLVLQVGNKAPVVAIVSPNDRSNVALGESLSVSVNASDSDGEIAKVFVFLDKNIVDIMNAPASNSYFQTSLGSIAKGSHILSVIAMDNGGRNSSVERVRFTVGANIETRILTPTDDATIRQSAPSTVSNWGIVEAYGKKGGENAGLFKFDVASQVSSGDDVLEATLRLYAVSFKNTPGTFGVYKTFGQDSWDETSVTWNNAPKKSTLLSSNVINPEKKYYEFDVTAYIQQRVKDSTAATVWVAGMEINYELVKFESRRADNNNKPQLVVLTSNIPISTVAIDEQKNHTCTFGTKKTFVLPKKMSRKTSSTQTSILIPSSPVNSSINYTQDVSKRIDASCPNTSVTTLFPTADTSIQEGKPSSTGNWGNIEVYGKPGGDSIAALLRFDLSTVPLSIEKAELKLYAVVARNTPGIISVFTTVDDIWDEANTTWSNAPARSQFVANFTFDQLSEDRPGEGKPEGYYIIDVSDIIASQLGSATASSAITFRLEDRTLSFVAAKFESRRDDKEFHPILSITASPKSCAATIVGRVDISVPDVTLFSTNATAKRAVCDGMAESFKLTTKMDCVFWTGDLVIGDLGVNYSISIPAEDGAIKLLRVLRAAKSTTQTDIQNHIEVQISSSMGMEATDFQVIVEEKYLPARGTPREISNQSPSPSSVVDTDNTSPSPSSVADNGDWSPSPSSLVNSESSETDDDSKRNGSSNYEAVVGGSQTSVCPPFALLWLMHIVTLLWTI